MRLPAVRWALRGGIPDMEANVVEVSGGCLYCLFRCMAMFLAAIGVIIGPRYWRSPLEALRLQIQSLTASFRAGGGGGGGGSSTSDTSGGGSTGGG